jgi:hypothetical protein
MGKDKNAGGKSAGKKGKGGGDDSKDSGGATKVKGAQSINVRHILVSPSPPMSHASGSPLTPAVRETLEEGGGAGQDP